MRYVGGWLRARFGLIVLSVGLAALASACGLRIRRLAQGSSVEAGLGECAPDPAATKPSSVRALYAANGVDLNDSHSAWPTISRNQHYVGFHSWSTNLVPGVSGAQSYAYDVLTGAVEVLSRKADGTLSNATGGDVMTGLSCTGRYALFATAGTNLTSDVVSGTYSHLFWKDRETGEIRLVSKTAGGTVGNAGSVVVGGSASYPQVSADGRYVVFATTASNLESSGSSFWKIVRKDMTTGAIELVSSNAGVPCSSSAFAPDIDATGNLIAYYCRGDWNGNPVGRAQLYLKNMTTGENRLLSRTAAGTVGNSDTTYARMSGNGEYLSVISTATDLDAVGGAYTHGSAAYSVFRVRVSDGRIEQVGPGLNGQCCTRRPGISYDGSILAWHSAYAVAGMPSTYSEVVAKNMNTGAVSLVSKSDAGVIADNRQEILDLSPDGKWAAFQGLGTNLVPATTYQANWQLYMLSTGF